MKGQNEMKLSVVLTTGKKLEFEKGSEDRYFDEFYMEMVDDAIERAVKARE